MITTRKILTLAALPLFLVGCLDGDDDTSAMAEEDQARAAATASVITGSLNNPNDDDGSGMAPLSVMRGERPMQMEPCMVSGSVTSGSGFESVGSPYTSGGEIDLTWQDYENCEQTTDFEMDGYSASGTAETGNVSYSAWSSGRSDGLDPANNKFVMDWSDGTWEFGGEMHNCTNCSMGGLNGFEGHLEWVIQSQGEKVTFGYGKPGTYFVMSATGQDGGQAEQTIDGDTHMQWHGTPCEYDVNYETISPLIIENYGTSSAEVVGGEIKVTLNSGTNFNVTYQNGNIYLDGELIDPTVPTACDGVSDVMNTSS